MRRITGLVFGVLGGIGAGSAIEGVGCPMNRTVSSDDVRVALGVATVTCLVGVVASPVLIGRYGFGIIIGSGLIAGIGGRFVDHVMIARRRG